VCDLSATLSLSARNLNGTKAVGSDRIGQKSYWISGQFLLSNGSTRAVGVGTLLRHL